MCPSFAKIACATAATLALLASAPPAVAGPSYNCNAIETVAEHTVCTNAELARLDRRLAAVYFEVRRQLSRSMRRELRESQRGFLEQRNSCGADYDCLREIYEIRLSRLKFYL